VTGNSHLLFWLRVECERACPPSACAWLYECRLPCKPTAHTVSHRLFTLPQPSTHTLTFHTLKGMSPRLCLLLRLRRRRPCRPERRWRRSTANGRIPVTHTRVLSVSNRSSSHFYSYNRVDDVSNNVLTHIRRVRRCQKRALRLPRHGYSGSSPVPSHVLTRSVSCPAEDRKGREACQRQEEHWRA